MSYKILHLTNGYYMKGYKFPITKLMEEGMFKLDKRATFAKKSEFFSLDYEDATTNPEELEFDLEADAFRFLLNNTENVYLRHQQLAQFSDYMVVTYFEHLQKKFPALHIVMSSDKLEKEYADWTICELAIINTSKAIVK